MEIGVADSSAPFDGEVFVLKEGQKCGPFSLDEIFDGLENGTFLYEDVCLREGATECERIRELLDWEKTESTRRKEKPAEEPEEPENGEEDDEDGDRDDYEEIPEETGLAPVPNPVGWPPNRKLYIGHPSVVCYPWASLGIVGGVVGGIWLSGYEIWLTFLGFALALLCFAWFVIHRSLHKFTVTGKRVEMESGFIARSTREALISDIRAINVVRTGLMGMIGVGSVEFNTTGDDPEVVFSNIWRPAEVKMLVRKLQDREL